MLDITRVKYRECFPEDSTLVARCTVVFCDSLMIHDIEIHEGVRGYYVSMPRRKKGGVKESRSLGRTGDVVHPLNRDLSREITDVVLRGYEEYLASGKASYYPKEVNKRTGQWGKRKYYNTSGTLSEANI